MSQCRLAHSVGVIREQTTGPQHGYRLETGGSQGDLPTYHTFTRAWVTCHSLGRTTLSLLPASPRRQVVIGKMGMPKSGPSPKRALRTRSSVHR